MVITPPEAPTEGRKAKASKLGGQDFLINWRSKDSFLVSWRQMTSHLHSVILALIEFYSLSELRPLIFQHKIF